MTKRRSNSITSNISNTSTSSEYSITNYKIFSKNRLLIQKKHAENDKAAVFVNGATGFLIFVTFILLPIFFTTSLHRRVLEMDQHPCAYNLCGDIREDPWIIYSEL
ncbi:unnamed protein product [Bursaphelenchus xylophilus]|uniref:(pine wood nematode) hypothetical protein n=1 Tax=Bursaphelenchus xylophilus TaxID=6326 RepID=A0A1I7RZ37_BURXY|nr:unnamed protein product [Bursaphelenchus xylophilus]CAG9106892.1 unnamed protein product [Bursaphelenchus xylophilus]